MERTLSIVVPVHNEAEFIPIGLPDLIKIVDAVDPDAEILLVENGSNDGTADVARQVGGDRIRILELETADYGEAMRTGFLAAKGAWVVNFDIDYFSETFLRRVRATDGAHIVIGSKRDPGSEDLRPPIRRLATVVFNVLLSTILGSKVSDTHGMKGFHRSVIEELVRTVESRKDLFDTELVIRAERARFKIVEVPVIVEEMRQARSSLVRRVPRTLRGLFRIRAALAAAERDKGAQPDY